MIKIFKPYKEIKPFNKRSKPKFIYPDGSILKGEILDEIEIERPISEKNKIYKYLFQKIKWIRDVERIEFRICYYYNDLDDPNNEWIFGQYALTLSKEEMLYFIKEMKNRKWI